MDTDNLWEVLRELLEESTKEYEQLQQRLKEIEGLLRQSLAEVDRLTRQHSQIAGRLRQMEARLDKYSAREIHQAYKQAQALQMRLFTMRSQVDQLKARQEEIERYAKHLKQLAQLKEQLGEKAAPTTPAPRLLTGEMMIRIVEAREKERRLLARQMHDGPAQALTNLILQAEICEKMFSRDQDRARTELSNLKRAAEETFQQIRNFIFNLRPMMLDDLGLIPTLRRYTQEFEKKSGIKTLFTLTGRERKMASYLEVILFRAVQELLENVHAHSGASQVQIHLDVSDEQVTLVIEDNGTGFDVKEALASARYDGISSIQENIEAVGGTMQIQSSIGKGTRITIETPLLEPEPA